MVQQGPCDGLHKARGVSVQGRSSDRGCRDMGKQQESLQSSSHPQSHCSPGSTTPLPHIECCGSVKHPLALRALALRTGSMDFSEHGENLLLFFLSPEVARANII